ncbi:hypothetical protein ACIQZD_23440 [Peribacillus sp. NPDC096447]|uniref:hypothetical protein n=1 Tax=Peribacillus sp. NPDC096447 TaxID=3364394 RepID=UPI00381A38EF
MEFSLKNNSLKFCVVVSLVFALILSSLAPGVSAATGLTSEEKGNIISNSVYYNTLNDSFEVNSDQMREAGLKKKEIEAIESYFEFKDGKEFSEELGVDLESDSQQGIIPVILIPIAQYLIGAVGAAIIYEVTVYGISKACKSLKGKYDFFTDFCKTRGYI